jgi:aminoglycoside phosphotransferase (APT) family kinase protein
VDISAASRGPLLARGRESEVFAWGQGHVLKLYYDWVQADQALREAEIGRVISALPIPAPRLLGRVCIHGRQGLIFERVDGPSMDEALRARPWLMARMARSFAALHAQIHREPGAGLRPVREVLRGCVERAPALAENVRARLLASLSRLPDGDRLCHMDFHPGQVIASPAGLVAIDWVDACQGDPAADVARTALVLTVGISPDSGRVAGLIVRTLQGVFRRAYLKHYYAMIPGVTPEAVRSWTVPMAAARLNEGIPRERRALLRMIRDVV